MTNSPSVFRGQNLNYSLDYLYYPDKPHQAERIGNLWYRYDANGNVTEEREGGHSPSGNAANGTITHEGDVYILDYGFGLERHDEDDENVYTRTFTWDEENRLKRSIDDITTVDYLYDSSGKRTVKHTENSESLYFDAMWSITSDYPDFRQSKHIYVGESRIATKLNIEGDGSVGYERVNTYYYHTDHLGSAQLITDYEGNIYEHMEYTPYGELWIEEKSESFDKIPFRFTGKELDEETGFIYFGARYLSPKTGNWFSSDPNGINLINPNRKDFYLIESLNWYSYAENNPVFYYDPTGMDNKVAIVGNDSRWGARKSFREAAEKSGYKIISNNLNICIPIIGDYGATTSGKDLISVLSKNGSVKNPITHIFISSHGTPYAIDLDSPGNNLYTSQSDVQQITGNNSWNGGAKSAFLAEIVQLVKTGIIAPDVTITLSACLTGATSKTVPSWQNPLNDNWARINANNPNPNNFAKQLSTLLPQATIIASETQVDSGKGMDPNHTVIYINGVKQ